MSRLRRTSSLSHKEEMQVVGIGQRKAKSLVSSAVEVWIGQNGGEFQKKWWLYQGHL